MRLMLVVVVLLVACDACEDTGPARPPIVAPEAPEPVADEAVVDDEDATVEVVIDDDNRFVQEDLDFFLDAFPDVVRDVDEERMRSCVAEACLDHGVDESVTPFSGPGVRYLVPLWLRGCLTGSAEACLFAGRTYQSSRLTIGDEEPTHPGFERQDLDARFRRYIARACDLSDAHCVQWAEYRLADDDRSDEDVARALSLLRAGCDARDHAACEALATHAEEDTTTGEPRELWRLACEHDPATSSDSCSRYAELLLATGREEDRAAAIEALGPTCDVTSDSWADECRGDPEDGSEVCDSTFLLVRGRACVKLAATLPPDAALRMYAALCVDSLEPESNAYGAEACREAARLAREAGRSEAFLDNLHRRTCGVREMECLDRSSDLIACEAARRRCERGG